MLGWAVNHRSPGSLATSWRIKRIREFLSLIAHLSRPGTILDIGGEHVLSHRLVTEHEMRTLFLIGRLCKEKLFGLTKSFVTWG